MSHFHRGLLKWARVIHLYLTLFALALILFFAVTGFMLNHEDWFSPADPFTRTETGSLPIEPLKVPDKLTVVELLRRDYGAAGGLAGFEEEEERFRVTFTRPGSRVEAIIMRETGAVEVTTETRGLVGVVLDLHRGKATGRAWSFVIDVVCGSLMVVAGTGLIMWWSLRGRGRYGLAVIAGGATVAVAVYRWLVP